LAGEVPENHPAPMGFDDRAHLQPGDRVLVIIEDDANFARIVLETARQRGFKVVLAQRGDLGLSLARKVKASAITLDLRLPDVDGWLVLDQLKRDRLTRHIPVIIMSGDEQRQRALRMGALGYL